jgi:hypothetical protein
MTDHSRPNTGTCAEEALQAQQAHQPDREPTADKEKVAEDLELDPGVSEHEPEMAERGAHQQGEGRLP